MQAPLTDAERPAPERRSARTDGGRNLVVCCDGTNNTLTGGLEDTNVLLLYGYLRRYADPATTLLFYDPGVGSPDAAPPTGLIDLAKRRFDRIAGLASGRGVYENIGEGYRFLMQNWQPADRIFCFGFSRGAFTARGVVGMVNLFGVLRPEHETLIPTLVRIYFSQPPEDKQAYGRKNWRRSLARLLHSGLARPGKAGAEAAQGSEEASHVSRDDLAEQVRREFARPALLHWVGVWDTVESVGLPLLGALDNPATATFHDKPAIRNVRHALALDEHRWPFLPRLYDAPSEMLTADGRTLKQLWFPGVHCDVGGSYPARQRGSTYPDQRGGLEDAALIWMVNEVDDELGVPTLPWPTVDAVDVACLEGPGGGASEAGAAGGQPPDGASGLPLRRPFPGRLPLRHDALHDTPYWALAGMTVRDMRPPRVITNEEYARAQAAGAAADTADTGGTDGVGVAVDIRAERPHHLDGPSVWDERRAGWPVWLALLVAAVAFVAAGWNLLPQSATPAGRTPSWHDWPAGPAANCGFAVQQLASVSLWSVDVRALWPDCAVAPAGGLRRPEVWARYQQASPAWAMAWDFLFIVAAGYLIARLASRVFTWLAGFRQPGQPRRRWLLAVGWLPALTVGADALENGATLLALALPGLGLPTLGTGALLVVGACSVVKFTGYASCAVVFGGGRLLLALLPAQRVGAVGRRSSV